MKSYNIQIILGLCSATIYANAQVLVEPQAEQLPDKKMATEYVGSVQIGLGSSALSADYARWHDAFASGNVAMPNKNGVLNWELSKQNHFGETGQAAALSWTREINSDWYAMAGVGVGAGAEFLPRRRFDLAVYRKWLENRQLVTGLQLTQSTSGNRQYRDRSWLLTSSYYFDFPLVAELGIKSNTSNPGDVTTSRYYLAGTYGENKKYYLSARYDIGREGYLPAISNISAVNFKSQVGTLSWRRWVTNAWGFEVGAERYINPFYRRNSFKTSIFNDF